MVPVKNKESTEATHQEKARHRGKIRHSLRNQAPNSIASTSDKQAKHQNNIARNPRI
jgi:hypothetical protein